MANAMPLRKASGLLLSLLGFLVVYPPSGGTQQGTYYQVAPKIYVPFHPDRFKVLHRSERLFVVEIPHGGYAFNPRISPFGDKIIFVPGLSTFAFISVHRLEKIKSLGIPQDVQGAPHEIKGFSGSTFSFDRQVRTLAFSAGIKVTSPDQPETEVCIVHSDGTGLRQLTRPIRATDDRYSVATAPALSEDGNFVVYRRQYAGYLGIVRTDGTGLRILVQEADGLTPVVLTRRGVLFTRGDHTQIWRATLDGSTAELIRERGEIRALAADLEGRKVAYVTRESEKASVLKVIDGRRGAVLMTFKDVLLGNWTEPAFRVSGDGRKLLYAGLHKGKQGIYVVDLQTKEVQEVSTGVDADGSADLNETGEIVVMTKGTGSPLALAFLPDETPPYLWVDTPLPTTTFTEEPVRVSVRYQDQAVVSGVNPQMLKVFLNDQDVTDHLEKGPNQATGQLGKELLKEGENLLEVRVKDRAGNETRKVVRFQFKPKPKILVEFHRAGGVAGIKEQLQVFEDGS
ncbi:MAG: hypothetical protein ABIN58_11390, partial [candidate division WOR-3 bacterium]